MFTLSQFKNKHRKLITNTRGFSSIAGAVFAFIIIISLVATTFVWSLSQNNLYNNTVTMMGQRDSDKRSEIIQGFNATYRPNAASGQVTVLAPILNIGTSSIQITRMWISDMNVTGLYGVSAPLSYNISAGAQVTIPATITMTGVQTNHNFTSWIVTARGNVMSTSGVSGPPGPLGPQGPPGNTSYEAKSALVSQGIGSIAMNFTWFRTYDFGPSTSQPPNGTLLTSGVESKAYTLYNNRYYVIRIALINMDSSTQSIRLAGTSYIWAINPQKGTLKGAAWNVLFLEADNRLYTKENSNIVLPYNTQVNVYFGIEKPDFASAAYPTVVPLNILLYGQFVYLDGTTSEYGQNLPFVAMRIPS